MTFNSDIKITWIHPHFNVSSVKEISEGAKPAIDKIFSKDSMSFEDVMNFEEHKEGKKITLTEHTKYSDCITILVNSHTLVCEESEFIVVAKFITKESYSLNAEYYVILAKEKSSFFVNGIMAGIVNGEMNIVEKCQTVKLTEHTATGEVV